MSVDQVVEEPLWSGFILLLRHRGDKGTHAHRPDMSGWVEAVVRSFSRLRHATERDETSPALWSVGQQFNSNDAAR